MTPRKASANNSSKLVATSYRNRKVAYTPVAEHELNNISGLGILFQVFYGLFTTSVGALLAALVDYLQNTHEFGGAMQVVFWTSVFLTITFGIMTFISYRLEKSARLTIFPKNK